MSKTELRDLIFSLLYEKMQGDGGNVEPAEFVGVQGDDAIIVFQKGGAHLGIRVVEAKLGA
jgi:hypothetical protein